MATDFEEFVQFMTPTSRPDVKLAALQTLLDFTTSDETCYAISRSEKLIDSLLTLLNDEDSEIKSIATSLFTNLSSVDEIAESLVKKNSLMRIVFQVVCDEKKEHKESVCKLLSNLSRSELTSHHILQYMKDNDITLDRLVNIFCKTDPPHNVDYMAGVFSNLTQLSEVRSYLMHHEAKRSLLVELLPFITYNKSERRREGIVGMVRNCCFDQKFHEWLLSEEVDLLPRLLLPLAGPEEFDEDEMSSLPLDLQYLGSEKEREQNPQIRQKILEALLQLCATKNGRQTLRDNGTYLILRELHKWEKIPSVQIACENVVQILIGEEPNPDMENLKMVDIPRDLTEKFIEMDKQSLTESTVNEEH